MDMSTQGPIKTRRCVRPRAALGFRAVATCDGRTNESRLPPGGAWVWCFNSRGLLPFRCDDQLGTCAHTS